MIAPLSVTFCPTGLAGCSGGANGGDILIFSPHTSFPIVDDVDVFHGNNVCVNYIYQYFQDLG